MIIMYLFFIKVEERNHEGHQILASMFWKTRLSRLSEDRNSARESNSSGSSDGVKITAGAMRSVMASLNKMAVLRERAIANKGNITSSTPLRKFVPAEVEKEVERILSTALKGVVYDPKRSGVLAKSISESVRGKLKNMKFPRYKFVCMVTILDKTQPSLVIGSRCLWNESSDNYVTVEVSNASLTAIATVYAVMHE